MNVCVVLTARPSWSKLQTVCRALQGRLDVHLQLVACASALVSRFGDVAAIVESQGYPIAERVHSAYAGSTLETSAKETGMLLLELAGAFTRLEPDVVLVCADRHEVLAAAQAAAQLHIPLVHLQGGEITGSIDDKCRDAITQLADVHCVATQRARWRVYGMTGSDDIHVTGCPSIDVALETAGEPMNTDDPFVLLLQHPVTNELTSAEWQLAETLQALQTLRLPAQALLPGADAGQSRMREALLIAAVHDGVTILDSLPPGDFLRRMQQSLCLVGNSSAGIRESSALGVPVVDIGSRQQGRERAGNVRWAPYDAESIAEAIIGQLAHGRYRPSSLYGQGHAGEQIAEILCRMS